VRRLSSTPALRLAEDPVDSSRVVVRSELADGIRRERPTDLVRHAGEKQRKAPRVAATPAKEAMALS
jgi:hypothetical protein